MEVVGKFEFELSRKKIVTVVDQWSHLILLLLAVIIILPGLGSGSLRDWDEAIYAQVSKEMIQSNDWINLNRGYEPYFEKPPLLMWTIAIFFKLFGVSEFSTRVPSAISGILLVYMTYLSGRTIYGNRAGFLSGLVLLSSYGFVSNARNGTTNMMLSLFVFVGVFAFLRLRNGSQKWWYLISASFALAFMVKFWAGLVLPAILGVIILWEQKTRETLGSKHFWLGLLLAILIVMPWHLLVYLQNDQGMINAYITRNLFQRTLTSMDGHDGSTLFYLDALRLNFSPWFFLLPFVLTVSVREIIDQQKHVNILMVQTVLIIGLYTFVVNTKIDNYILPVFPALSIMTAYLFVLASSTSRSREYTYLITAALIATTVVQNKLLILCIFIGLGFVIALKKGVLQIEQIPQPVTSLIFIGFVLIGTIGSIQGNNRLPIGSNYRMQASPVAQIATLAGKVDSSEKMPLIGLTMPGDWGTPYAVEGPAALYYSNRPVDVAISREHLHELMAERNSGEILIAEKYLSYISEDFKVLVIEDVHPLIYASFSR